MFVFKQIRQNNDYLSISMDPILKCPLYLNSHIDQLQQCYKNNIMHIPYRGLINPSENNCGGVKLIVTEKYNHRVFLDLIKPEPRLHKMFQENEQKKFLIKPNRPQTSQTRQLPKSATFSVQQKGKACFFRRVKNLQHFDNILFQSPQNYVKSKKIPERSLYQFLQGLDPCADPYGHKETKYRRQLRKEGKSLSSDLENINFKEECMLSMLKHLERQHCESQKLITIQCLTEMILCVQQELNLRSIGSFAKLFNYLQQKYTLSLEDVQGIYYKVLGFLHQINQMNLS